MKNYLVWYRMKGESEDIIRGTARNYTRAETMAKNLAFHLKSSKIEAESVGVKSGIHGVLYRDQELHMRWSVVPPEEEKEE
jgi:hypothetical protein